MAIFIWFFYILFLICFAYSCRCIQTLGPQYWSPWTIKVCGTSGLQYGIGSTLGNNCISESGMQPTTLPMNMTFLLMLYFVAKPWEGSLSTTHYYLFEAFFLSKNILIFQSWGFDYKTTHKQGRKKKGYLVVRGSICMSQIILDEFTFACMIVSFVNVWMIESILFWKFVVL